MKGSPEVCKACSDEVAARFDAMPHGSMLSATAAADIVRDITTRAAIKRTESLDDHAFVGCDKRSEYQHSAPGGCQGSAWIGYAQCHYPNCGKEERHEVHR